MPQLEGYTAKNSDKIKNLFWISDPPKNCAVEYFPHIYIEAKIDFSDVRTGFRDTINLNAALELYTGEADALWADDMVHEIDPSKIGPVPPDGIHLSSLPQYVNLPYISRVETQFTQYLMRSYEVRVYRNFDLNVYSSPGETMREFIGRCRELSEAGRRHDLDSLHEVFNRRLEQLKQKYLSGDDYRELERTEADSRRRNAFFQISERIADLFLNPNLDSKPVTLPARFPAEEAELEERLAAIHSDAQQEVRKVHDVLDEKARAIDEYILHPNLKDIHLVRSCILWMP